MGSSLTWIGGSFALILFSSAVLGLVWFWRARVYRVLVHPVTAARDRVLFDKFPVEQGDVVFLGDSLTRQGRWGEMYPGVPVRNRGVSGDTTSDVHARLPQAVRAAPAQIFLMIGTNDLGLGRSAEVVLANLSRIVSEIRRISPATTLVLQTLLPREAALRSSVEAVNRGLAALAEREGLPLVDVGQAMRSPAGTLRPELTRDGLHLLDAGYQVWKDALDPWVRRTALPEGGDTGRGES